MGFSARSIRRYPFDHDVSDLLLIADTVLHGSFNEEPSFPPLLLRAMSFGVPIIAPNISQITKHVSQIVSSFFWFNFMCTAVKMSVYHLRPCKREKSYTLS